MNEVAACVDPRHFIQQAMKTPLTILVLAAMTAIRAEEARSIPINQSRHSF